MCLRSFLQKQVDAYNKLGYNFLGSSELEFYIYSATKDKIMSEHCIQPEKYFLSTFKYDYCNEIVMDRNEFFLRK